MRFSNLLIRFWSPPPPPPPPPLKLSPKTQKRSAWVISPLKCSIACFFHSFWQTFLAIVQKIFRKLLQKKFENVCDLIQRLIEKFWKRSAFFYFFFHWFFGNFFLGSYFCFFDIRNGLLDPKNLEKESKQLVIRWSWFHQWTNMINKYWINKGHLKPYSKKSWLCTHSPPLRIINQFHRSWNRL